ncbi:MAG TPA: A24 family peptidase [Jatrophihabitans sp.]|nr:A24 family peptidase [Jatrophihabitans sp.]
MLVASSAAGTALAGWATQRAAAARMLTTARATRGLRTRHAGVAATVLAGALGGLLAWRVGAEFVLVAGCWIAALAPTLAMVDLLEQRLPDALTLGNYPVLLILLATAAMMDGHLGPLLRAVIMMASVAGFFAAVAAVSGGVGLGDVKLAGALGLVLGYRGVGTAVVGVALGLLCGALAGAAVVLTRRGGWRTRVPFGPALLAGALAALLL